MLALECETGMLLSYYKGGLITENNVFVFSSAVLVTQCYVRANLQLLKPAHMTVSCTGIPGWRWSAAKVWKRGETGAESHLFRVHVGATGDEEWCMNSPRSASFTAKLHLNQSKSLQFFD